MNKILLVIVLGFSTLFSGLDEVTFGPEICDNGIDDDNNGFIDCFDTACDCSKLCASNYYTKCDSGCVLDNKLSNFNLKLKWTSRSNVWHEYTIPIVADLDGDGQPEIIGKSGPHLGGPRPIFVKDFNVYDGVTGQLETTFSTPYVHYKFSAPAIGDVDRNGTPEIFIITGFTRNNALQGRLMCYEYQNGAYREKWIADRSLASSSPIGSQGPPSLVDFNQDGIPEVYISNYIFNAVTGEFLTKAGNAANTGNYTQNAYHNPSFVIAADVLDDNQCSNCEGLELIAGNEVYSVDINGNNSKLELEVEGNFGADGFTSIADMDRDGDLDAVVVWYQNQQAKISVWDLQTPNSIGSTFSFDARWDQIGLANIADFDGDGFPEIGVTGPNTYRVVGLNGTRWENLWSKTTEDISGQTGSTVFDFNGDGIYEVVYRDEDELRIFEGSTGNVLFSTRCRSGTGTEYPVVADVDGDGATEILCGCDNELLLWSSSQIPWVPSREVWNQHMYFNVNINDDLTIPFQQQSHHIVGDSIEMNTFLAQYGDARFPAADAFILINSIQCKMDEFEISITICNRGSKILSQHTPITIYNDDPTTTRATIITTQVIGENIDLQECYDLIVTVPKSTRGILYFVVNDDGSHSRPYNLEKDFPLTSIAECDFTNNIDTVSIEYNIGYLDLGPDQYVCDLDTLVLDAGEGFLSYLWQDGSVEQRFTAQYTGWYIVEVLDECDDSYLDSVFISISFSQSTFDTIVICPGDTVWVFNEPIFQEDNRNKIFSDINKCDSTVYVHISLEEGYLDNNESKLCAGDSVFYNENWIHESGRYQYIRQSNLGCDSLFILDVIVLDPIMARASDSIVCYPSDSIQMDLDIEGGIGAPYSIDWGDGKFERQSSKMLNTGLYKIKIVDEMGCLHEFDLTVKNRPIPSFEILQTDVICNGDSNGMIRVELQDDSRNWQFAINGSDYNDSPNFTYLSQGSYQIGMIDQYGCAYDTIIEIKEPQAMDLNLPADTTIELGQSINIESSTSLNPVDLIYSWRPSLTLDCDDCTVVNARPFQTTTYSLSITDKNGCTTLREITIYVKVNWKVYVPNVFSPNGDGINDGLTVFTSASVKEVISLDIYDRWGELVYRGGPFAPNEPAKGWNGNLNDEPMNPGVYVYVAHVRLLNDEVHSVSGNVTLVR